MARSHIQRQSAKNSTKLGSAPFGIDTTELTDLATKFGDLANGRIKRRIERSIQEVARVVAEDAKRRAVFQYNPEIHYTKRSKRGVRAVHQSAKGGGSGYSTGKTRQSIHVEGTGFRTSIIAGGASAPEAALLENGGRKGYFKHPVFERSTHIRYTSKSNRRAISSGQAGAAPWVSQKAHPFMRPAVDKNLKYITETITAEVISKLQEL